MALAVLSSTSGKNITSSVEIAAHTPTVDAYIDPQAFLSNLANTTANITLTAQIFNGATLVGGLTAGIRTKINATDTTYWGNIGSTSIKGPFFVPAGYTIKVFALSSNAGDTNVTCNTYFVNCTNVSVDRISDDETAAGNLEAMLDGTGASLRLTRLHIENASGQSAVLISGGADSHAVEIYSLGDGHCVYALADESGSGIYAAGGTSSGSGFYGTTQSSSAADAGFYARGIGTSSGIYGESTGAGHGAWLESEGNGHGILACSDGTGNGAKFMAGTTGHGVYVLGGTLGGDGVHFAAQGGNADGMQVARHGTGADLRGDITGSLSGSIGSGGGLTAAQEAKLDKVVDATQGGAA